MCFFISEEMVSMDPAELSTIRTRIWYNYRSVSFCASHCCFTSHFIGVFAMTWWFVHTLLYTNHTYWLSPKKQRAKYFIDAPQKVTKPTPNFVHTRFQLPYYLIHSRPFRPNQSAFMDNAPLLLSCQPCYKKWFGVEFSYAHWYIGYLLLGFQSA